MDFGESPIVWENEYTEEENQNEKWIVKQHILFLIDASEPMFNTFNNSTFFSTSVEICKTIVMKLIRKSRNDKIGIVLFNSSNNDNDTSKVCPKSIKIVSDLIKPNINLIKKLDILQTNNTPTKVTVDVLADAIWYSNYLLKKLNENQSCGTIMLITCNDNPNIGDSKKLFNLRKRLDDVIKSDIDFKLIPIGATFCMKNFYEGILNNFSSITKPTIGLKHIDEIMSEINDKIKQARSVSKINFLIDDDNYFSVSLFNFYTKSKIPTKVILDKRNNKPTVSVNQTWSMDNDELMFKSDIAKYCLIGNEKIIFKNQDISILKSTIIDPGIRLLGFTSKENIMISYHFKTSTFIRPNNDIVENSSLLFNTLLECCLEKEKIIMCFIKVRHGGRTHLAALVPQPDLTNENGIQPSGFIVLYLPFAECIREIKPLVLDDEISITDQQLAIAETLCEKMSLKSYCPPVNPKINAHWAMLEAMALELAPPEIVDETLPSNHDITNNLIGIKNDIIMHLFPYGYNLPVAGTKKRGISAAENNKKEIKRKK